MFSPFYVLFPSHINDLTFLQNEKVLKAHINPDICAAVTFVGATMSVILDLSYALCIWISAAIAIIYTLLGGLYSVAYTDIIQLTLIFLSLVSSSCIVGSLLRNYNKMQFKQSFSGGGGRICFLFL